MKRIRWVSLVLVVFILAACSESAPQATPLPPSPTEDELSTLLAMQQIATSVPTATPVPPPTHRHPVGDAVPARRANGAARNVDAAADQYTALG